ncbi:MAG: hypothetical protein J5847_03455 [Clostridia bacterium]|nr:hypothetical protein [Clostridia bacterium]
MPTTRTTTRTTTRAATQKERPVNTGDPQKPLLWVLLALTALAGGATAWFLRNARRPED